MFDADTLLANKKSILSEIAPKIIVYAHPKKKTVLEVRSILTAFEELTVGLEITSIEYLSKTLCICIPFFSKGSLIFTINYQR